MVFRNGHCDVTDLDEDADSFVVLQNDTRLFLFNGDDGCLDNEGDAPTEEGSDSTLSLFAVNVLDVRGVVEQRFLLLIIPDSDADNETFCPVDSIHSPLLLLPPRLRCCG